jgi:catechol 2,3-dioxygenase
MPGNLLDPATRLGAVHLNVSDLDSETIFYSGRLGLKLRKKEADTTYLGAGGEDLLVLHRQVGGVRPKRSAGLYHFCLAVGRRKDLGLWLKGLLDGQVPLQGLVDHRMAEAIYLSDPEGNGVELNWDRPKDRWPPFRVLAEEGNAPLDVEGLLSEAGEGGSRRESPDLAPADTRVGHVHLHLGDLKAGQDFYCGIIGFDRMFEFPGQAVFTSAGGYHHHVAFNVWQGKGAPPNPPDALGLRYFTVVLRGKGQLEAVLGRARAKGLAVEERDGAFVLKDPSHNGVLLSWV